jgi:hypothetical protein
MMIGVLSLSISLSPASGTRADQILSCDHHVFSARVHDHDHDHLGWSNSVTGQQWRSNTAATDSHFPVMLPYILLIAHCRI